MAILRFVSDFASLSDISSFEQQGWLATTEVVASDGTILNVKTPNIIMDNKTHPPARRAPTPPQTAKNRTAHAWSEWYTQVKLLQNLDLSPLSVCLALSFSLFPSQSSFLTRTEIGTKIRDTVGAR